MKQQVKQKLYSPRERIRAVAVGTKLEDVTNREVTEFVATSADLTLIIVLSAGSYGRSAHIDNLQIAEIAEVGEGYTFGFNGQERDDEIKDNGNSYDFGERILDVRLGCWLSLDPLSSKYPSESPYMFVGDNPMIFIDPTGEEKIIVTGGDGNEESKDRNKFLNSSLRQLNIFVDQLKKAKSTETVTFVVFDNFITQKQKKQFERAVKKVAATYKGEIKIVYINNGQQLTNYLNSKNINIKGLSKEREKDKISDASIFMHGYDPNSAKETGSFGFVGSVEPGHGQDMEVEKALSWSLKDVIQLNPNAWKSTATLNFESCNSATDGSLGTNLAQVASKRLQIKTTGWLSTCSYEGIYGPGDGGTNVHAAKNAVSEGDSGVKKTYEKGKNK
jgi:RHS repeat-associated protein